MSIEIGAGKTRAVALDLTSCDREPIHVPGAIQPHGVLFALGEPDLRIVGVSANLPALIGPQPDGTPWRFGVRHPREPEAAVGVFELSEGALATSGDYERFFEIEGRRFCHILDPRTGWPARGLSSVSVVAGQCLVAGALATAAMVLGRSGAAWLAGLGVRHLVVDEPSVGGGVEPLVVTC